MRVLVAGNQHERAMRRAAVELPNITMLGYVPADRLALYMRDSFALFFPTRYETFGIAAAEALAAGTPVITCRCTAVPEILGDAGIYVDADRPEAAVEVLTSLYTQPGLRSDVTARGRQHANAYTWAACVGRLQKALEQN
jgi:glycosyltransferase involved in cell wall biosynthesis